MGGQMCEKIHPLTGLYNEKTFFEKVDERLTQLEPNTYCLVAIDIEHFRLFNKIYGRKEGDYLLEYVADCVKYIADEWHGIAGYLGGDNFGILMPNQKDILKKLKKDISAGIKKISNTVGFLPAFGVYCIDDVSLSAMALYDRATLALSHIIGNYAKRICYYDDSMSDSIEEEIMLLSEIQTALDNQEFTFFAQPQCDISTGKIVGAESLVRWRHHSKGLISPGVFIPVLEKNGFIADLDRYVWEKVCEWIRSWLDRGYHPVPISINVSRIDIFSMNVPEFLTQLIHKYDLDTKMLKIEITESAYAENNDKIKRTVKDLQEAGFLVMMDDFGSGYSSLNMLKNLAVDVLKIDMRFLEIGENDMEKGIGILESVVNMSRQMGVPIIVEGVETKAQEDFLLGMGCRYTQGFYYYKPLPIDEFEKILTDEKKLDFNGLWCKQFEPLHVREFLDSNIFSDTMLNNLFGATAFYDVYENKIEITRVNDQYYQLAGINNGTDADESRKFWSHVPREEQNRLLSLFEQAYSNPINGAQGYVHYLRADGKMLWVYLRVFFLREREGHKLFYSSLTDMTFLKEEKHRGSIQTEAIKELTEKQHKHLEEYYGDMPCAMGVAKLLLDADGKPYDYDMVYANRELENICGNMQRLRNLAIKLFEGKTGLMLEKAYQAAYLGEEVTYYAYSPVTFRYLQLTLYQFEYGYLTLMISDVTHRHIHEDALQSMMQAYQEIYYVHLEDDYYRMIYPDQDHLLERGNYQKVIDRWFATGKILPYDEGNIRKFLSNDALKRELATKDTIEYKFKKQMETGEEEWSLINVCVSERVNGVPQAAVMTMRTIDAVFKEEERKRRRNMAELLAHTTDGFFIYRAERDEQILYANAQVLKIFGCETIQEFRDLTGNSFRGVVHPDDLARVEAEIAEQVRTSERCEDYVEYRIIRKDGEVRWITDCGHLDTSEKGNSIFYVFIADVTDRMRK
ncbi:MAG: EAL domain-containing protein [Lachnospiraceae bacterium]|nr:EAL domain-containing protein [Lachnospiraceae bacterium]